MGERARIKEKPHLVKDLNNFAILNTDKAAVAQHKLKVAELHRKKQIENEINNLKSEVSEIKNMLGDILKVVSREKE
jgi:hypothetical protein